MKNVFGRLLHWEHWPFLVFYSPIALVWAWYCLRSRSLWFFSSSNPTLTFGGFEGEGKREMYEQLPPGSYPKTVFLSKSEPFESVLQKVTDGGFTYPLIVKPDIGMKGLLFRKIDSEAQLRAYHAHIPNIDYVVQDLVDLPMELSVFYIRHPTQQQGEITGMTYKELMEVFGDGSSTLRTLIERHPRASMRMDEMQHRHSDRFDWVVPAGEQFVLSHAANRNRGARLHNLRHEIDADLLRVFDALSHHNGQFFYGRYDIKCQSINELRAGRQYSILEFNGSGAAPNHVYHCGLTLLEAYGEIIRHWQALYDISRYNAAHGTPYWPFWKGLRYLRQAGRHFKMLEAYD